VNFINYYFIGRYNPRSSNVREKGKWEEINKTKDGILCS
jgi:hypothetical protein